MVILSNSQHEALHVKCMVRFECVMHVYTCWCELFLLGRRCVRMSRMWLSSNDRPYVRSEELCVTSLSVAHWHVICEMFRRAWCKVIYIYTNLCFYVLGVYLCDLCFECADAHCAMFRCRYYTKSMMCYKLSRSFVYSVAFWASCACLLEFSLTMWCSWTTVIGWVCSNIMCCGICHVVWSHWVWFAASELTTVFWDLCVLRTSGVCVRSRLRLCVCTRDRNILCVSHIVSVL